MLLVQIVVEGIEDVSAKGSLSCRVAPRRHPGISSHELCDIIEASSFIAAVAAVGAITEHPSGVREQLARLRNKARRFHAPAAALAGDGLIHYHRLRGRPGPRRSGARDTLPPEPVAQNSG